MTKKHFLMIVLMLTAFAVNAVNPHWVVDPYLYPNNMTFVGIVHVNGVEQSENIEIGVFCGEELRGSALPRFSVVAQRNVYYITIYGEAACDLHFRLWNHASECEPVMSCENIIQFEINGNIGNALNPYVIEFVSPYTFSGSGSWTLPSNWTGKDGQPLTELPDFSDEDVVIDGMAFIPNGTFATVKSLTINSEKVLEINNGASLTVTETIENDDDANSLVLNDGGQIFQTNENVKATFKKDIVNPTVWGNSKTGWQFISSPIVDAAVKDFIPENGGYDLYIWDNENVDEDEETEIPWVNYKAHYNDEYYEVYFATYFAENCGYLCSYENLDYANFKGDLNVSTEFEINLNYLKSRTWNLFLIGNTFTFDIEWDDIEKTTSVSDGFMSLNPETGVFEYHSSGTIKSGQGYVVNATKNTKPKPTLTYSKDAKGRGVMSKNINVIVSNSKGSDNVILSFNSSENDGFPKMENFNDEIATIFTVSDDKMYGISNYDNDIKEIPLCFKAKEIGTYTISMKPSGDFNYIHLIDRMTGIDTDMLLDGEYKFNALSSDNVNRFIVRLSDPNSNPNSNPNPNCFAYQSGGVLYINDFGSIQIFDMTGRIVMNETLNGNSVDISRLGNAAYIVRLVNGNGVKTQKIVVL